MITLFIDTSSNDVSIAVLDNNKILSSITKNIPNKHSIYTVDFIDKCLKTASISPSDIEKIMVVNGPGSFTGIRIGIDIAKVYAYLQKIPLILISSLKSRAISCKNSSSYYLSLINAKSDNYYLGLYDTSYNEVMEEHFSNIEEVLKIINEYHPNIVTNEDIIINSKKYEKTNLNIEKIVSYYQMAKKTNPHFAVPNYLKLPQAMEKNNNAKIN